MESKSKVIIFIDDQVQPIAEFDAPVNFELDTRKLKDGLHQLKIISKDPTGKEGIKTVPFTVRNGPAITIDGIDDNDVVDGVLPLMINAYGKGNQKQFLIDGSETPKSVPSWLFAAIIAFVAWAIYFTITSLG
ncbi:cytochrome C [Flavobacterium adhaerens]|uniref:cytochrome C n=1 Tax=Flavobacterium adhaerens TaxID=3149043 RepID=UPI0032B3D4CA